MSNTSPNSELVRQLGELTPGRLPEPIFEAIARLVVTPTFVVVPLFRREGRTRVVLTRRDPGDTHYPGMLHPPGKIVLATDEGLDAVFARLVATELQGVAIRAAPVFVGQFVDQITRGREISLVHYLEIDAPRDAGTDFDPRALPSDVICTDIPRIIAAVDAFETALGPTPRTPEP